ncbi:MAG: hypothetical protein AAF085_14700, partial [Planctomycetota bacterium]
MTNRLALSRRTSALLGAALVAGVSALPATAQYQQIFAFSDAFPGAGDGNLSGVAVVGGDLIATNAFSNAGTNSVAEGPPFSTLVNNTDLVLAGADTLGLDPGQFYAISPTSALVADRRTDSIFTINTANSTVSQVATKADIQTFTGGTNVGISDPTLDTNGNIVFYDSSSDGIVSSSSTGTLSSIATDANLTAGIGNDTTNGLAANPNSEVLYFGDDGNDEIYSLDYSGVTNVYNTVLTNAEIALVTGDTALQVDNMLFGGDGLIYFYDGRTDSIYSFDPTDAANTLTTVINESDLLAGPGGADIIGGLTWVDGQIAWTVLRSSS